MLRWIGLVQTRGLEHRPGQLAGALREMGQMPDPDRASAKPTTSNHWLLLILDWAGSDQGPRALASLLGPCGKWGRCPTRTEPVRSLLLTTGYS